MAVFAGSPLLPADFFSPEWFAPFGALLYTRARGFNNCLDAPPLLQCTRGLGYVCSLTTEGEKDMEYLSLQVEGDTDKGTRVHLNMGDEVHKPTPYVGCPIAGVLLAARMLSAVAEHLVKFQEHEKGKTSEDVKRVREATISTGDPTNGKMNMMLTIEASREHNQDHEEYKDPVLPVNPLELLSLLLSQRRKADPKDVN